MKLFKKISMAVFSLILAFSCGLIIKEFIPQKQVKAAENTYKYRYLSDMSVASSFNLWQTYTLNSPLSPSDTINNSILLKRGGGKVDEKFTKAIVFNRGDANQEGGVVFNLSGLNATRFTSVIGINQTTTFLDDANAGVASFKVYGNGNVLFSDNVVYSRTSKYGFIDIDITGITELKLVTYDSGEKSINCEHAVFANPRIYGTNLVGGIEGSSLDLSEMPYEYKENLFYYDNVAINEAFPIPDDASAVIPLSLRNSNGTNDVYSKGICLQANNDDTGANPTKIGWEISGTGAYLFTAKIGINQRNGLQETQGTVKFQIRFRQQDVNANADVIAWTSETFTRSTPAQDISIKVPANATHIILAVLNAGDGSAFDNGSFVNPKLHCNCIDVSSMTASATNMGYGDLLYNETMDGKATLYNIIKENETLTYNQHTYFDKNLFTHATSTVDFSVQNMDVNRFVAYVGITSTKVGSDGIIFSVYADGTQIGSNISVVQYQQMTKLDVLVPAGTKTITLKAESAIGDNNSDHAIWCAPVFFGNNVSGTKSISLTAENDSLAVGESTNFKLYYCTFDNKVTSVSNFSVTSSNSSVATVNGKTVTAKAVGSAEIHVSVNIDGVTYSTYTNIVVGSSSSSTNAQLNLASPDGNTKIIVTLRDGWIDYSATKGGNLFVEKSRMGVKTSYGDMWYGFTFKSLSSVRTIDETYDTYSGKYAGHRNYCKEQDITFTHSSGATLKVIARAYNDGVAFRYVITGKNGESFTMINENTSICLPFFSTTWSSIMPENGTASGKQYTHEQTATQTMIGSFSKYKVIPFMYKTPDGIYCLMTESDLDGSYWGSVLYSEYIKIVRLGKSKQQTTDLTVSSGTLTMPWRAFMAGTLEEVVKSNMVEDLAPAAIEDPSGDNWDWVDPGIASWSWMDGVNQFHNGTNKNWNEVVIGWQKNPEAIKKYIDLAAEMGWEYFILDDGWQPWTAVSSLKDGSGNINGEPVDPGWQNFEKWYDGVFDWMTDKSQYHKGGSTGYTGVKIADYAEQKGVKLIAWLHTGRIDTEKRMNEVFGMLQDIGIAGIKVDFFDSESQWTMDLYQKLYAKTAEYHLLGIYHGSNKPTGERRTYPHIINREAIPGEELNNTKVSQQSIYAFLRGTVGPTDLTPYIYTVGTGDTNMASQMAFSIIYESGMTCFASTAEEYRALNENVKYYYKNFPDRWADLKLISGEVGSKMSIARKSLNNKWYIGCITVDATTDTFKLDFLDSGKQYYAHIYTDKDDRNAVDYNKQTVTNNSSLTLSARANGGYVVLLEEIHVCSFTEKNTDSKYFSTSATCTSPAKYFYSCTCGQKGSQLFEYASVNSSNHTGSSVHGGTANVHTKYSCCGATISSKHSYTTTEEVKATCTTKGTTKYSCTCGYSYTAQDIPTIAHDFTKQVAEDSYLATKATCTQKATYYTCCSECGLSSKGQTGETTFASGTFLDHDYGTWIEEIPAQVGVNGTKGHYHCSTCNKDFDINKTVLNDLTIPALPQPEPESSSSSEPSSQTPSSSSSVVESSSSIVSSPPSSSSQDISSEVSSSATPIPSRSGCMGNISLTYALLPLMLVAFIVIVKKAKKH
ncbi:MAG: NPCBM/NEW2 domain-containing protein [Clostridia bacterium]|nr:NPCBM/NEW2 domain-containing protein [Clostridia bacterium]